MNILQKIAEDTKERIDLQKKQLPLEQLIEMANSVETDHDFPFEKALRTNDIAFICEIKKASPSKGIITQQFDYIEIAKDYEVAGAAAISVLTEPHYFKGDNRYLQEIAEVVSIPLLRKDFIIDEYMIYEAKILGASAILLICSILDKNTLSEYINLAHHLGLSALVETHDEKEIAMALAAGARVIGVNNRNLKTFEIDMTLSERLKQLVPNEILFVSESGIHSPKEVERLREIAVDAVLIGESIMKSSDRKAEINRLRGYEYG